MTDRRRLWPALLLALALALATSDTGARAEAPAVAASPAAEAPAAAPGTPADFARQLAVAYRLLGADKPRQAMALLQPLRDPLEDEGNADLLITYYDLLGAAGHALDDAPAEIRGNLHSVLLNQLAGSLNAPDTVVAEAALAETYRRHEVREGQVYLLANVLAAVATARKAGAPSGDMEEMEAMADALMGQLLWAEERAELALLFLRRAQVLARQGRIDAANAAKLEAMIGAAEARAAARGDRPPPAPEACIGSPGLDTERMQACLAAADHAAARGDVTGADQILSDLLRDVPSGSLRAERYKAARNLLVLRQLNREAHDPQVLASADLVANYLASINEVTAAALIAARVARTVIDHGRPDAAVAQMCGHIARRASRNGAPELALRMAALQRAVTLAGSPDPQGSLPSGRPEALEPRVTAALISLESAHIAAASGLSRRAAEEWDQVDGQIASLDLGMFDEIERMTVIRYAGGKDYVLPTYAAAVEFVGRLARRLPADDSRHDAARLAWITAIDVWWGDGARADAMAQEAIAEIRAAPQGRTATLAELLMLRASLVELANPPLSARLTRDAYEIIAAEPGRDSQRIELLLDMAADQSDRALALALLGEAQRLREAAPAIALPTQVRLDLKRAFQAFDDGDRELALRLGEGAIASLVAAGQRESWAMVEPARNLAGLYAALGRMDDARRTYETYVLSRSNAAVDGEEKALSDQLGLANLEAYYAPGERTIQTLATLLDRAQRRVKADRDLGRRIQRAQAFAYQGMGDGPRARDAAVSALSAPRPQATDTSSAREDRKLLETLVGADWLSSGEAEGR